MRTSLTIVGVALAAMLAVTGVAAAAPFAAGDASGETVRGPIADDRPLDGTNSPWVTGDDRLEQFQERFDLTDEEMDQIHSTVTALIEEGADRTEIRTTVTDMLDAFGVDDPELGPPTDRGANGERAGSGPARGNGMGAGPHGPADGTCLN